jgi:hypothetical protein
MENEGNDKGNVSEDTFRSSSDTFHNSSIVKPLKIDPHESMYPSWLIHAPTDIYKKKYLIIR